MEDNKNLEQRVEATPSVDDTNTDYIAAIQQLRENSVERAKYDKLKEENKRLVQSLVNGENIKVEKPSVDVKEAARKVFTHDPNKTNLQCAIDELAYRDAVLEKHGVDVLLPNGPGAVVTQKDIEEVEFYVSTMRDLIDYANGDPALFRQEFNRRLQEPSKYKRY